MLKVVYVQIEVSLQCAEMSCPQGPNLHGYVDPEPFDARIMHRPTSRITEYRGIRKGCAYLPSPDIRSLITIAEPFHPCGDKKVSSSMVASQSDRDFVR